MPNDKKPDQVVFDEKSQTYNAALKPYATNVGAPAIKAIDTTRWKDKSIYKANKQLHTKYQEIKAEYDKMLEELEYNNLVYSARFNFEPIVGETYHLYKDKKNQAFLSIITPSDCNFNHIGSFSLNSELLWKKAKAD